MWATFTVLFALISAGPGKPLLLKAKTGMIAPVPQGKSLVISKNLRITVIGKSLYIDGNLLSINRRQPAHDKTTSDKGVIFHVFDSRAQAGRFNFQREMGKRPGRSNQFLKKMSKR